MPFLVGIKRTLQPALDKLPMEAVSASLFADA